MNLLIESTMWRKCAELMGPFNKWVCRQNLRGYGHPTGCLSSGSLFKSRRGIKCTNHRFWRHSSQFSDYPHATQRQWISGQLTAQPLAQEPAQSARSCWTAIRSKALLLVALLVQLPAKTNSFGSNRSLATPFGAQLEPFNSFISPLLNPLRVSVRGSFSCLNVKFGRECPALNSNFGSIKGETYV